MIKKVLIANRGEIALRVIRGCHTLGIKSVAVYSTADSASMHMRMADEAYWIGESQPNQSYLRGDEILRVAKECGAEAIHPGYGFLSENADFARKVEAAGIIWMGPPADAIDSMGDKLSARQRMHAANVPIVPGTIEPTDDVDFLFETAKDIGFPVMIKAVAGGGGKGIRLVEDEKNFHEAFERASSEAGKSFSNPMCYVEKAIYLPRHIEVQVMCDNHGNAVYLFERECSVQRRHQKVIEEAPSPFMTPERRKAMGEAAVRAAVAVDYRSAGTIEFLVDGKTGDFYFMEMNTRLQVEHPITELITNKDLVQLQLMVASGEPLPFKQDDLEIGGHAIEVRVCAENADENYLPALGKITHIDFPFGPHVRLDAAIEVGMEVLPFYDPMLAKLVVWGKDRPEAIARLKQALSEFHISGVITNLNLFKRVLELPEFIEGSYDTGVLTRLGDFKSRGDYAEAEVSALIAAALAREASRKSLGMSSVEGMPQVKQTNTGNGNSNGLSPWAMAGRKELL